MRNYNHTTNLPSEPLVPRGWKENVQQKRAQRGIERRYKTCFGIDSFDRPGDPLGHWIVFIKLAKSCKDSTEFDKKTRRPKKVFEHVYLPLQVDREETVWSLYNRIKDAASSIMRHHSDFHLEIHNKPVGNHQTMDTLDIEDDTILTCVYD